RLAELRRLALRVVAGVRKPLIEALQAVALGLGRGEAGLELRDLVVEAELAELFQRQQLVALRDLGVELLQRLVLAGYLLRQEELHEQEDGEQERDRQHQRRQRVDESGPVVEGAFAAAGAGKSHVVCLQFRVPDAVQRATLLRRAETHISSNAGPRLSS